MNARNLDPNIIIASIVAATAVATQSSSGSAIETIIGNILDTVCKHMEEPNQKE